MAKSNARKMRRRRRPYKRSRRIRLKRAVRPTNIVVIKRSGSLSDYTGSPIAWSAANNGCNVSSTSDGTIFTTGSVGSSNVTYYSYSIHFKISAMPSYTEFTQLFDRYKIVKAVVTFVPFVTGTYASQDAAAFNNPVSVMHHRCYDRDDSTLFSASNAGLQDMRQRKSYRFNNFFAKQRTVMTVRYPSVAGEVVSGAGTGNTVLRPPWIDSDDVDVQHYGVKGIFEVFAPESNVNHYIWFRPELTLIIQFKDPL